MKPARLLIPLLLVCLLLTSCAQPVDRTGRLLGMAAEEAAQIPSTLERFTRQLNIADTQIRTGRPADALQTLRLARDTLAASNDDAFDSFHRIAGWTAIAQLARAAGDRGLALKSADLALDALNNVSPITQRARYVLSLSGEIAELRGRTDAIELLNSGAGWAAQIADTSTRRAALTSFAMQLIDYDAFDIARNTLRQDSDAAWRTDTFLALANGYGPLINLAGATGGRGGAAFQSSISTFGQDVRFENVYKR